MTALQTAGLPVLSASGPPWACKLTADASAEQRAQADALVAAFDDSDAAQAAFELAQARQQALELIVSPDPAMVLTRAAHFATYDVLVDVVDRVNQLIAAENARGGSIPPVPTRTQEEAVGLAAAKIESGAADAPVVPAALPRPAAEPSAPGRMTLTQGKPAPIDDTPLSIAPIFTPIAPLPPPPPPRPTPARPAAFDPRLGSRYGRPGAR